MSRIVTENLGPCEPRCGGGEPIGDCSTLWATIHSFYLSFDTSCFGGEVTLRATRSDFNINLWPTINPFSELNPVPATPLYLCGYLVQPGGSVQCTNATSLCGEGQWLRVRVNINMTGFIPCPAQPIISYEKCILRSEVTSPIDFSIGLDLVNLQGEGCCDEFIECAEELPAILTVRVTE